MRHRGAARVFRRASASRHRRYGRSWAFVVPYLTLVREDAAERKKGSKLHQVVHTLGHLLALKVTPANEQDRADGGEDGHIAPAARMLTPRPPSAHASLRARNETTGSTPYGVARARRE